MELEVRNIKGSVVKKIKVPEQIFNAEPNDHAVYLVVKALQANRRQGTHMTKTRSFVSGGGKKPFKQKGTGGARQGSTRSPLQPGGGQSHGPVPRDYRQKISRSLKNLALTVALTDKAKEGKLFVVDDFALSNYSTKHILKMFDAFKVGTGLLSDERKDDFLYKSSRNIKKTFCVSPAELNVESVLRSENLFLSETALSVINQRLLGN